jgi:hypothetical protein
VIDSKAFDSTPALAPIDLNHAGRLQPGERACGHWTLVNYGDADVRDGRLRLETTPGLRARVTAMRLGGRALGPARRNDGATISLPTLAPGERLECDIEAQLDEIVENSRAQMRAVLACAGLEFVSPPTILAVSTRPRLVIAHDDVESPDPHHFALTLHVGNDGSAQARDLVLHLPAPAGTRLRAHTLLEGASVTEEGEGLRVSIPRLGAHERGEVRVEGEVDHGYPYDAVQLLGVRLRDGSGAAAHLEPLEIALPPHIDLSRSSLVVEDGPLHPGQIVTIGLEIRNDGRSDARDVRVRLRLPGEIVATPESARLDGVPLAQDDPTRAVVPLARAGASTVLQINGIVRATTTDGTTLTIGARVGRATLPSVERSVRGRAAFRTRDTFLSAHCAEALADRVASLSVVLANAGSDAARRLRVRVNAGDLRPITATYMREGAHAENAEIVPASNGEATVILPDLPARARARLALHLQPPAVARDGTRARVCARIEGEDIGLALDPVELILRGAPQISVDSSLRCTQSTPLRPAGTCTLVVTLRNDGSEAARNVRVSVDAPPCLSLADVTGARRLQTDGDEIAVAIDEIAAGAAHEALLHLRAGEIPTGEHSVVLHALVQGETIAQRELGTVDIHLAATPALSDLRAEARLVEETIEARLRLANDGDGEARNVQIVARELEGYLPGTTRLNGRRLLDARGASPLRNGLVLGRIGPGETIVVSYAVAAAIHTTFIARFDVREGEKTTEIQSAPCRLQPALRFLPHMAQTNDDERARDAHAPQDVEPGRLAETEPAESPPSEQNLIPHDDAQTYETSPASQAWATPQASDASEIQTPLAVDIAPSASVVAAAEELAYADTPSFGDDPAFVEGIRSHLAPIFTLRLDARLLERIAVVSRQLYAVEALGTYRHVFAARLFLPSGVECATETTLEALERLRNETERGFGPPLLRTAMGTFAPDATWRETLAPPAAVEAAAKIARDVREHLLDNARSDRISAREDFFGYIAHDEITLLDDDLATPQAASLHAIVPLLIPSRSRRFPLTASALEIYRKLLIETFASLLHAEPARRDERMVRASDQLDAALRRVLDEMGAELAANVA